MLKARLQEDFAPMLNDSDMGTLYETANGADDFEFAASMCHGWSALPIYFNHAVLLGVTPLEPGFKTFQVMPWAGDLPHAAGEIVTPQGKISVSWQRQADNSLALTVKHPAQLKCVINAQPDTQVSSTQINSY